MGKASRTKKQNRKEKSNDILSGKPVVVDPAPIAVARSPLLGPDGLPFAHKWLPHQDPSDPDTGAGSPYTWVTIDPPEEKTPPMDKYRLGGGPESGLPCMQCNEITRYVDEICAYDILEPEFQMSEAAAAKAKDSMVAILMCPKCESLTQMRADMARSMMQKYNEGVGAQ